MKSKRIQAREIVRIALFTSFICICSFISVPVGTMPVTLQLFGIYLALFCLGGGRGSLAVALYVALGAVGLPVFSGFSGGVGRLVDAGGGFILGFIILSLVYTIAAVFMKKLKYGRLLASALSLLSLYAFGSLWYSAVYLGDVREIFLALLVTVFPFVILDLLKIYLAYVLYRRIYTGIN